LKNKYLLICLLSLFSIQSSFAQQRKEVLFIGNSYTYYNNLPDLVKQIALSFGDSLIYDSSTPGGSNFNSHTTNTQTLSKINQQQWDYVVLQSQSQEPSFSPAQVANDTYPYAEILVDSIYANSSCTEPLFFMTWGRKYGDQQNCAAYPPICTYLGMQQRLRESYLEMAFNDSASCAPVGMAWKKSIAIDSTLNLYSSDNSHPSIYGSYLAACTFYSSIFKKSALGSSFWPAAIDSNTAYSLQQIGSSTVLDSLVVWNIFNADFGFQQYNDSISFTNLSSNYDSILWNFGDGTTSFDENPIHVYANSGLYTISLSVFMNEGCILTSQSINISVNLGVLSWNCLNTVCVDPGTGNGAFTSLSDCNLNCSLTSIKKIELDNINIYPNPSRGIFNLSFKSEVIQDLRVEIFNVMGVKLVSDELEQFIGDYTKEINLKNYDKGVYFLEIKNNNIILNKKLILN